MSTFWTVQLLTADYLIDGYLGDDTDITRTYFLRHTDDSSTVPLRLSNVHFQPTSNLAAPEGVAKEWMVFPSASIALIPRDQVSSDYVVKHNKCTSLIPANIYAGPYLIHGAIMSPDKPDWGVSFVMDNQNFAVRDAVIDCLTPGARLHDLKVPLVVVRSHQVQGLSAL